MTRENPLTGALCVGHHDLFDSVLPLDHYEAREMCQRCPVIAACEDRLAAAVLAPGEGPTGTWAGRLIIRTDPRVARKLLNQRLDERRRARE